MALFSSKKQITEVTNQTENNQVAAGSNGFAAGAGSNVTIENISDEVANSAFDANKQVSRDALDASKQVARDALDANVDVSSRAFDLADDTLYRFSEFGTNAIDEIANTTARQTSDFLSFADRFSERERESVEDQLDRNNRFAMHTSELIAAQAGVTAPADGKRNQYLVFGALALVALAVVVPQLRNTFKSVKK